MDWKCFCCRGFEYNGGILKFERDTEGRKCLLDVVTEELALSLKPLGDRERSHNEGEQERHNRGRKDQHFKRAVKIESVSRDKMEEG